MVPRDSEQFPDSTPPEMYPLPLNDVSDDVYDGEYEVESLLAHQSVDGVLRYLVKWVGYPITKATWEPEANLGNATAILEAYKASSTGSTLLKGEV